MKYIDYGGFILDLEKLGWSSYFEESYKKFENENTCPGRIASENRGLYSVYTKYGKLMAEVSGKLRYIDSEFPSVGDWVVVNPRPNEGYGTIYNVLPRKSKFSRTASGENPFKEQVVASNVDIVFVVTALNQNFNIRRIERYLTTAWDSGANPVVILSKADLCADYKAKLYEVENSAAGVPIHAISAVTGYGLDALDKYLKMGKTTVLLGSSGVGKSTLVNLLMGEKVQEVNEINYENGKGRHTTTSRQMILLPSGAILIDTPGMRALQLWDGSEGLGDVFEDIEELAKECRFADCSHKNEPGCAVRKAVEDGTILPERLESYLKLQRELMYCEKKQMHIQKMQEKRIVKNTSKKRMLDDNYI